MRCDIAWKHLKYAIYGIILGNWCKSISHLVSRRTNRECSLDSSLFYVFLVCDRGKYRGRAVLLAVYHDNPSDMHDLMNFHSAIDHLKNESPSFPVTVSRDGVFTVVSKFTPVRTHGHYLLSDSLHDADIGEGIIRGANPLVDILGIVNGGHIPTADIYRATYAAMGGILCL